MPPIPLDRRNVHLLGICGTAMTALAGGLAALGCRVTGSDEHVYPPMSDHLRALGIAFQQGYDPAHIPDDAQWVVVGNVIRRDNPEAEEMRRREMPHLSMAEAVFRYLIAGRETLVVAGTHGKTTTTALAAHVLTELGAAPGFLVGGIARNGGTNFRQGEGRVFVIEGDEYDTAYFDKTPKFFKYHPHRLIFTSLEFDHADIYPDLAAIRGHFSKLVAGLPAEGVLIAHGDDPEVAALAPTAPCRVVTYGAGEGCDLRLEEWRAEGQGGAFDLAWEGRRTAWRVPLPGIHNALNAAAVIADATLRGHAPEAIQRGLDNFAGVKRRQEVRGVADEVTVLDDFAHHPTAVRLTIEAVRAAYPQGRLWAVFEPRSFTARGPAFQDAFPPAFLAADQVVLAPAFRPPGGAAAPVLDTAAVAAAVSRLGGHATAAADTGEILALLLSETAPGDVVLVMSNGGFDDLHERLLDGLRGRGGGADAEARPARRREAAP